MGKMFRYLLPAVSLLATATLPVHAGDCAAQCRAAEMQCLQQSKGDTTKCNAIATQCYQSCRKQR